MFIVIQIMLVAIGLLIMARGRFTIGNREVGNPMASLVGIVLMSQLPLALLISIVFALTDGVPETVATQVPTRAGQVAQVVHVPAADSKNNYWWVDPLVTCAAVLAAAGLTAMGLQAADDTETAIANLQPLETVDAQ
jgi:hypothetical protein